MPLFGTILGQEKHAGHPLWIANLDGSATFRVRHLLTATIIKGYFSKKPSDFKKQYERARLKHDKAAAHPVIPQLQPLAAMQDPNHELPSSEADSDLSDSDLDDNNDVDDELVLIANSVAKASERRLDPAHPGGEAYQGGSGGLIEASIEELNTTAGIPAEFAVDLNVPADISGK